MDVCRQTAPREEEVDYDLRFVCHLFWPEACEAFTPPVGVTGGRRFRF